MKIQILGSGCAKCKQLTANAEEAVKQMGLDVPVEKVSELSEIMKFGVMVTPAIVIDGEVKSVGKVNTPAEIMGMLNP